MVVTVVTAVSEVLVDLAALVEHPTKVWPSALEMAVTVVMVALADGGGGGGVAGGNSFAVYVEGFTPDPLWVSADNDLMLVWTRWTRWTWWYSSK